MPFQCNNHISKLRSSNNPSRVRLCATLIAVAGIMGIGGVTAMSCAAPVFDHDIDLENMTAVDGARFINNEPNSVTGKAVSTAGDFNGDGYDDFIVGSSHSSIFTNFDGCVYLVFGQSNGYPTVDLTTFASDNTYGFRIANSVGADSLGFTISSIGDLNNDGYDDIIIGCKNNEAYVVLGRQSGNVNLDLQTFNTSNDRGFRINGVPDGQLGYGVAGAGDVNGDGFDDFMVGSPHAHYGIKNNTGAVYVILGKSAGNISMDIADFTTSDQTGYIIWGSGGQNLGQRIAPAGDFNGDGFDDIVVSGIDYNYYYENDTGGYPAAAGYIVYGKANGFSDVEVGGVTTSPSVTNIDCTGPENRVGASSYWNGPGTQTAGDFNGDGFSDLLISSDMSYNNGLDHSGSAYVLAGREGTTKTLYLNPTNPDNKVFRIDGHLNEALCKIGSGAGDINDDGKDDILLNGQVYHDNSPHCAVTYVIFGRQEINGILNMGDSFTTGTDGVALYGSGNESSPFPEPSNAGDVNGDGVDDLVTMQMRANTSDFSNETFLVYGKSNPPAAIEGWPLY